VPKQKAAELKAKRKWVGILLLFIY
jgi:hypothetical protein